MIDPSATSEVRLDAGIIGAGRVAAAYEAAARGCQRLNLVGVADIDSRSAEELAARLGCTAFTDHTSLIERTKCDVAIVCTPPNTHARIVTDLVDHGVHVLCEKPLAIGADVAAEIIEAATRRNVLLAMAAKFRYVDDIRAASACVASGELGTIHLGKIVFSNAIDMRSRWNSFRPVSGGGVLIDNGTHALDMARFVFGPLRAIRATEGSRTQDLGVEETVSLDVTTAYGTAVRIELSWNGERAGTDFLTLHGSRGELRVGWRESRVRASTGMPWRSFGRGYNKTAAFTAMLDCFLNTTRGTATSPMEPLEGWAASVAVDAAYASLAHSGWEPVDCELAAVAIDRRGRPSQHPRTDVVDSARTRGPQR